MKEREWTEKEVDVLKKLYPSNATFGEIRDTLPGRTDSSIRGKAARLGLKRRPPISEEDIEAPPPVEEPEKKPWWRFWR